MSDAGAACAREGDDRMSMEQGWSALNSGDATRAAQIFEQIATTQGGIGAYTGLVRATIAMGNHDQAQGWAQHAASELGGSDGALLMAQVFSERGKRAEAARILQSVLSANPNHAFALALMAEQRIRQGYWDDGTQRFIEALSSDHSGEAFVHLQRVLADLVDAVIARRVKPVDAIKFVNKVDYTAPKVNPELGTFLALARRSLNTGSPLPRPGAAKPVATSTASPAQAPPRTTSSKAQPMQSAAPRIEQAPQRMQPKAPAQSLMAASAAASPASSTRMIPLIDNGLQTDFMKSMREDRRLNEELQDEIQPLRPSTWPSALSAPIDTIPEIGFSGTTISEQVEEKRKLIFRVTEGSMTSQIYLERALKSLLGTIPVELTGTLQMMPEELSMLDVNCTDGLLEQMTPVTTDDLDEEFVAPKTPDVAAMGAYLGQCIVNSHRGCWRFEESPLESVVLVGHETFSPFEVAEEWRRAPHDVALQDLMSDADCAQPDIQLEARSFEHIDLTAGLAGRVLLTKLAEVYSFFRFALVRVQPIEILDGMELLHENSDAIVFSIQERWMPKLSQAAMARGKRKDGTYAIAYTRRTGEFWFLCRLKDLEGALTSLFGKTLEPSTSARLLEILSDFHAPGAQLARTQQDAKRLESRGVSGAAAPSIMKTQSGNLAMVFWVLEGSSAQRRILELAPEYTRPWGFLR